MPTKKQPKQETAAKTDSIAEQLPKLIAKAESIAAEITEIEAQVEAKREELAKAREEIQALMEQHPEIFGQPKKAAARRTSTGGNTKSRSQEEWQEALTEIAALEKEHGDFDKALEAFNAKHSDKPVKPATVKAWQKKLTSK
jgi:chaperonin cofactor prefoldin